MVISISNHKGGTGKTTTAVNIAVALTKKKKRVLLIDLDPQGNLSYSLGIENLTHNITDVLLKKTENTLPVIQVSELLDITPWDNNLYQVETELKKMSELYNYSLLKTELNHIRADYDFVIIDCPPSFSVFTTLALAASDYILIPVLLDVLSIQGLSQIITYSDFIRENYNRELEVLGVVAVIVDERRQLTFEVLEFIKNNFGVNIFNNYVRCNVKAAEAPSFAKSVIDHAPDSNSSKDYLAITNELLKIIKKEKEITLL